MAKLDEEYKRCNFKWNCKKCDKKLCLRIAAIADFPTMYGHFEIIAFTNNKDKEDRLLSLSP